MISHIHLCRWTWRNSVTHMFNGRVSSMAENAEIGLHIYSSCGENHYAAACEFVPCEAVPHNFREKEIGLCYLGS